ncbi:MAG: EAL domain-containing protein [Gammaproteobacteria bacterium]
MFELINYNYNAYAIPMAVTTALVLFLGLWVLVRERKSPDSILFFLLSFVISIWFFAFTWMYCATNAATALAWAKAAYTGIPLIPAAIYHFSVSVLQLYQRRKILVWLSWVLAILFSVLIVGTDALISQVYHYWWGFYPSYGKLGVAYLTFFFGMIIFALGDYVVEYRKIEPGTQKLRLKWFMIASGILFLGSVDYLAKFGIPIYPFGYLPVFVSLLIAAATIKRYHLADLTPEFAAGEILETMQGAVLMVDLHGSVRGVNRAACATFGYQESEFIGLPLTTLVEAPYGVELEPRQLLNDGPIKDIKMPWRLNRGGYIDVSVSASVITDRNGFPAGVVYVVTDMIECKRAEAAIAREERYALVMQGARDGWWDWNLKTNEIFFSPRWKAMLSYEESDIGTRPDDWFQRIHTEEVGRVKAEIAAHLEGRTPHYESEHRMLHKDGTYRWILSRGIAIRDSEGKPTRFAGSQTDVTERKLTAEQLSYQALYDPMTNLPNRTLLIDVLRRAIARSRRDPNYSFCVVFMDLDRFKVINDSLGHLAGDQLLINVARRLEACLRPTDTAARFGGDEFTLLLEDIPNVEGALNLVNRLQQQIMQPFKLSGQEVSTTASIGIAMSSAAYGLPEEMLRDANTAMYSAKSSGKANCEVFNASMHTNAAGRWNLEADLRRAVEREEFLIHYQPIVSVVTGKIIGIEALVRWLHPQRGLMYPSEFITLAEETGLIRPMGYWLLRKASAQNRIWYEAGYTLRMAVNVSAGQFQDRQFRQHVEDVLIETGMPAQSLELEITESIAMENVEYGMATLDALNTMGVHISIDDFGTGHSSLAYLKRFTIKNLKLDQSFLKDVRNDGDGDNGALATAIITMAHSLKLNVIAEGVETPAQVKFLRAQGCDEMQGYLISRPVTAEVFTTLLREGQYLPPLATP